MTTTTDKPLSEKELVGDPTDLIPYLKYGVYVLFKPDQILFGRNAMFDKSSYGDIIAARYKSDDTQYLNWYTRKDGEGGTSWTNLEDLNVPAEYKAYMMLMFP